MSAATPAPIWWCVIGGGFLDDPDPALVIASTTSRQCKAGRLHKGHDGCGERLLVSRSALVVERDAEGNWKLPQDTDRDKWHHGLIASVLDDLAAAEAYR